MVQMDDSMHLHWKGMDWEVIGGEKKKPEGCINLTQCNVAVTRPQVTLLGFEAVL
jgi:hypothetical protein